MGVTVGKIWTAGTILPAQGTNGVVNPPRLRRERPAGPGGVHAINYGTPFQPSRFAPEAEPVVVSEADTAGALGLIADCVRAGGRVFLAVEPAVTRAIEGAGWRRAGAVVRRAVLAGNYLG